MEFSGGTICIGDTDINLVFKGDALFWASPNVTVVDYRSTNGVNELYSGSPWYNDVIYNGITSDGNYAVVFRGIQTTFYRLFKYNSSISELTIPECITTISGDTVFRGFRDNYNYCILIAKPHIAPVLLGTDIWYDSQFYDLEYPDDADYSSWFLPGFTGGTEVYYNIERDGGGNSILNGLYNWNNYIHLYPQFVRYENNNTYGPYIPTVTSGWDGNYIGSAYIRDSYDRSVSCYVFSKKVINVPSRAFFNWRSTESNGALLMFPNCTETIGSEAFRGAKLAQIPRFRYAKTLGDYALYGTGLKVMDLPSSIQTIGNYSFPTTTERINAYNDIQTVGTLNLPSSGVFAYTSRYGNTALKNAIPASWIIQPITDNQYNVPYPSCIVFDATSNTLTITIKLFDSTEGWEDGYFYIMDNNFESTQLAYIDHYEQSKTVTYPVQSGNRYYIYYDIINIDHSQSPGWEPKLVSGGNVVAVNLTRMNYNAQTANIVLTRSYDINDGLEGQQFNNSYRYGYEIN